jgi:hypothetical protein
MSELSISDMKYRWNEVLDLLESQNRIAWLAYFDARLVSFDGKTLTLNFVDAEKLAGAHDFSVARKANLLNAIETAASEIFQRSIAIKVI